MMTRTQKDQVWDIFPTEFEVPVINDNATVTFISDTATADRDVQIVETFQPDEVRYPTVQIQYASADTRVNFMDFQFGDEKDYTLYQAFGTPVTWTNCQGTPIVYDLVADAEDITSRIGFQARLPSTSLSYLRVKVFENSGFGTARKVYSKDYYPEEITEGGQTLYFNFDFNYEETYKIQFSTYGDSTGTDLGVEIYLDNTSDPVVELYKYTHYEVHGQVENLKISIRVVSDDKLSYKLPGSGYYCEAQDIVDHIVKAIETSFFKNYDGFVDNSRLIKVQNEYDMTSAIASGSEERLAARQVDFLVVNENRLRSVYTTPKTADILIITDTSSDTL